jgi:hypothetical protein
MATGTNLNLHTGEGVDVLTMGAWHKGIVTNIDTSGKTKRPYKVLYEANGISDEEWFEIESVKPS